MQGSPLVGDGRWSTRPGRQVKERSGRKTAGLLKIYLVAPIESDENIEPTFEVGVAVQRTGIGHAVNVGAGSPVGLAHRAVWRAPTAALARNAEGKGAGSRILRFYISYYRRGKGVGSRILRFYISYYRLPTPFSVPFPFLLIKLVKLASVYLIANK